jgi:RNA polymerase sigma factor (TIGR02999 family)
VSEVTRVLEAIGQGDAQAAAELLPLVYDELRKLAAIKMADESAPQTLQPTALVHEVWLRLAGNDEGRFANRAHFFSAAATAMRRILVERARQRHALKRGARAEGVSLDQVEIPIVIADDEQLLAIDEALEKFARIQPRKAELVKLRYFTGRTFEEAASALGIAVPTAKEWWAYSRAWLAVELQKKR